MDQEFLDLYNRELKVLREQAVEFAEEYPGIAERLGGMIADRQDPMIAGLLEGAAFLAARVQLKLKHEFLEFTANFLEQVVPNYLAPTPSALLIKITPPYSDPALREGRRIGEGVYFDATYRERTRRLACRYRLSSAITLWPFDIAGAEYLAGSGQLQALGVPADSSVLSGLRLSLTVRTAARLEDEAPPAQTAKQAGSWFAGCRTTRLPVHILDDEASAVALYELLFAHCSAVYFRFLDEQGNAVVIAAPADCLQPVGFAEAEALIPNDNRLFRGFDYLREYFMFPRKFLGFELTQLSSVMPRLKAKTVDVVFAFQENNQRLAAAVGPAMFSLYTAPAVNLFDKALDRISLKTSQHEYHVIPDRSRYLDFEPHRLLEVYAHFSGNQEKKPVRPLYSLPLGSAESHTFYTIRRLPRRRSAEERKYSSASDYTGTDMFISVTEPAGTSEHGASEISIRALCSNRHLTEQLPIGEGGADFRLADDTTLDLRCVAGPTPPKGPVVRQLRSRQGTTHTGEVAWQLVNMMSVNHLGLTGRGTRDSGSALRETLSLFADMTDSVTERKIRGLRSVESRPVTRRIRQPGGTGIARGLEVTVTLEERSFEGSGVFLLGAILDQFFSEYVTLNHFSQLVLRTVERGEIKRWPPRMGARHAL